MADQKDDFISLLDDDVPECLLYEKILYVDRFVNANIYLRAVGFLDDRYWVMCYRRYFEDGKEKWKRNIVYYILSEATDVDEKSWTLIDELFGEHECRQYESYAEMIEYLIKMILDRIDRFAYFRFKRYTFLGLKFGNTTYGLFLIPMRDRYVLKAISLI